jgi:Tol biopolymer transport system component
VLELNPHWSPNGAKLVVARDTDEDPGSVDIYILNSDGTNAVRLTETRHTQEFRPQWSPDGRQIAFIADTILGLQSGGLQLWAISIIDADGSRRERLTPFAGSITGLTWSADGTRIVFGQFQDLCVMNLSDRTVTKLTDTPTIAEAAPSWRRVR